MARRLPQQSWMAETSTRRIVDALTAEGAEVRFVGGCIRDALLGRPVRDVDMATNAAPEDVISLLAAADIKSVPTGIDHGTVTAVSGGKPYEITTLRTDVETDGRHARVAFGRDWEADAGRRDFTFNAMSLSPDGTLFDPFDGERDLKAGRVKFVGAARERIAEDILRLLRWFRFYAHYGRPPADAEALSACEAMAERVDTLSGERVRHEFLRLLAAPDPMASLRLMHDTAVLRRIVDAPRGLDIVEGLVRIDVSRATEPDPVLRLAALLPRGAAATRRVAERLRLSNEERDRLVALSRDDPVLAPELEGPARRAALYRLDGATARDRILLAWAAQTDGAGWQELLDEAASWTPPRFPLGGRDVTELGICAGPEVGEMLRQIEDWWIAGDFAADRETCLAELRKIAASSRT